MANIERFEDSKAWMKGRTLFNKICAITEGGKFSNDYRFRSQIESAAGSVMDNIAEGFDRGGNKELIQFLIYSKGSAGEVRSQLYRAFDKGYISAQESEQLRNEANQVSGMIQNWINYLKTSKKKGRNRK